MNSSSKSETMCNKVTSFTSTGLSMLDRCVDAILMFWNRVDAFFGWPENPTRRSEQYWRRVDCLDDGCDEGETLVWNTVITKLKAPGRQGNLGIFVPPRTPFVQEDMEVDSYEIQRLLDPSPRPVSRTPTLQMIPDESLERACLRTKKSKAAGKLGMLRIVVPATESFVEEARYANEYYKQKKLADKILRQTLKRRLPPVTASESETTLSSTTSIYFDCDDAGEPSTSSHYIIEARRSNMYGTKSIACLGADRGVQADDVWLDIYSQEASRRKVRRGSTEVEVNIRGPTRTQDTRIVYWSNDLSAQPSGFWDQM